MNNFEEQLKREAQKIRLSTSEKDLMRSRMFGAPSPHRAPTASPYFVFSFQFAQLARYALAALVLFAFAGGGTVSAAYLALPGDLLYPVKVSLNERVELALATTPEKKLETEVRLAERRVAEAQALDAEGRLDTTTTVELEQEFDKHVANALALAAEVSTDDEEDRADNDRSRSGEGGESGAEGDAAISATMALKVEDESSPASINLELTTVATTVATGTATSTQYWSRGDNLHEFLKVRREVLRELRERAQNRQEAEVKGYYKKNGDDNGEDKNANEDNENNDDGDDDSDNDEEDKSENKDKDESHLELPKLDIDL